MATTVTTTSITPTVVPYCREKQITFNISNLLSDTELDAWFDEYRVTRLIRRPNIIEVTNTGGKFKVGDVVGYKPTTSSFIKTGTIIDVYKKGTGATVDMRLYIIDDFDNIPTDLVVGGTLHNAYYDSYGVYVNSTDSGTIASFGHLSGKVAVSNTSTQYVTLNGRASSVDNYYNGNTFNIITVSTNTSSDTTYTDEVAADYPVRTITAYNGTTKVATLSAGGLSFIAGQSTYSIGKPASNEIGKCSGVFYLRGGVFPTGKRIFRLDNRFVGIDPITGNYVNVPGSETTYAQATYFATGTIEKSADSQFSAGTGASTATSSRGTTTSSTPVQSVSFVGAFDGGDAYIVPGVGLVYVASGAPVPTIPINDVSYGGGCPDPDTLIFCENSHWVRAGDLSVGDKVVSIHEHSREPGTFKILEAERMIQPKVEIQFANDQKLKVSSTHKFLMSDDTWKKVCDISIGESVMGMNQDDIHDLSSKEIVSITDIGDGEVIKFEIDQAHTYITEGLISHNVKQITDLNSIG
jgi:hypothetical protein